MTLTAHIHISA